MSIHRANARRRVIKGRWGDIKGRWGDTGFTLVEPLVVVSIIALLISILLPSLGSARESAKAVVCGTQLKQLGTACQMYIAEYNDRLFQYESRALGYRWLRPFLAEVDEIMLCPATRIQSDEEKNAIQWHGAGSGRSAWCWAAPGSPIPPVTDPPDPERYGNGSYAFNGWLFDPENTWNGIAYSSQATRGMTSPDHPYHYKRLSGMRYTSEVPLMLDSFEMVIYAVNESGNPAFKWKPTATLQDLKDPRGKHGVRSVFGPWVEQPIRAMPDRHPKFKNDIVFMDGHVEKVIPQRSIGLRWGPKFELGDMGRRPIAWPF